jgi:hypothetical protein
MTFLKTIKSFFFKNNFLEKKLNTANVLLGDFGSLIENRPLLLLVSKEVLPKFLEWHFKLWKNKTTIEEEIVKKRKEEKLNTYQNLDNVLLQLNFVLQGIIKRSIKESMVASASLFPYLESHTDKYQKEKVGENNYLNYFFNIFCIPFFEQIAASPAKFEIQAYYFPKKWKITKENITNVLSPSRFLWNEYEEWASQRVRTRGREEFDKDLEIVTQTLFPNIDSSTWAKIFTFMVSSYSGSEIQSAIERKEVFGIRGMISIGKIGEKEKEEIKERMVKNTIELSYILFRGQFSKRSLEDYIRELEDLKNFYPEESIEERRRMEFLEIFKKMLNLVKNYEGK